MVVSMKKAMFRYKMSLAGYEDSEIGKAETWVDKNVDCVRHSLRDAIYEYAKVCTDLSMVPTYIQRVDEMCFKSNLSYLESAKFVSMVIAGWCK